MASSSAPSSFLRQLLRYVSSRLGAALYPAPPATNAPAAAASYQEVAGHGGEVAPRGVDLAAADQVRAPRIGAPLPKGRPGEPRQGGGGKIHAAPPTTARVVMRGPTPPGPPAQGAGGSGGSIHDAPAS